MILVFCRYIIVKTFAKLKQQRSDKIDVLYNLQTKERIDLSTENFHELNLSHSEKCLIGIYSKFCVFFDVTNEKILQRCNAEIETESDFVTVSFDLDDILLMLINETGRIFAFNIDEQKVLWTIPLTTEEICDSKFHKSFKFNFTNNRKLICRGVGVADAHRLYVMDLDNGNLLTHCDGKIYPLDITLIHKSQQWIAAASISETVIDNVKSKPIFMWDIETGKVVNRIKGTKGSFKSATFLGSNHEYIAYSKQ